MNTKQLANGTSVSEMCLGTMLFGTKVSKEMSFTLMDMYADAGGAFLDTANMYAHFYNDEATGGDSERVIGEWMDSRGNRDSMFVATKVGVPYPGVERGLKPAQITEECEKSLKRLRTEVIDLYYAHFDDRNVPLEDVLGTFQKLVDQGKVRYLAASNTRSWRLDRARRMSEKNGWSSYGCIQNRYTYLYPKGEGVSWPQVKVNPDMLDYCTVHGLPIVAYGALLKGAYATGNTDTIADWAGQNGQSRYETLREVSREVGVPPNQVVLAWMMQSTKPTVIPLITASKPEHMEENLTASGIVLPEELIAKLDEAS